MGRGAFRAAQNEQDLPPLLSSLLHYPTLPYTPAPLPIPFCLLPLCLRATRAASDPRPRFHSRWLSKGTPDPDGFHLKIVAAVARVYMHKDKDRSPLTAAFAAKGLGAPPFLQPAFRERNAAWDAEADAEAAAKPRRAGPRPTPRRRTSDGPRDLASSHDDDSDSDPAGKGNTLPAVQRRTAV